MNVNSSVVGSLYGGWTPAASVPTYSAIPEGPRVAQAGAGFSPAAPVCPKRLGLHAAAISTAALIALAALWCWLPA